MRLNKVFASSNTHVNEIIQNQLINGLVFTFDKQEVSDMYNHTAQKNEETPFQEESFFLTVTLKDDKISKILVPRLDINDLAVISDLENGSSAMLSLMGIETAGLGIVSIYVHLGSLNIYDKSTLEISVENGLIKKVYNDSSSAWEDAGTPEVEVSWFKNETAPDKMIEYKVIRQNSFSEPNVKAIYMRYNHDDATLAHLKQIIQVENDDQITSAPFRAYLAMTSLFNQVETTASKNFVCIYEDEDDLCDNVTVNSQVQFYGTETGYFIVVMESRDTDRVRKSTVKNGLKYHQKVSQIEVKDPNKAKALRSSEIQLEKSDVIMSYVKPGQKALIATANKSLK